MMMIIYDGTMKMTIGDDCIERARNKMCDDEKKE